MIYPVLDYKCLKKDRRSSRTITFHICQRWQDFNCLKCLWSQSIPTTRSSIFIPSLQYEKWNCNQVNLPVQKQGPGDRRFTFNISTNQSPEIMRAKQRAKTIITFPVRTTGNWGIWIFQYVAFTENLPSQIFKYSKLILSHMHYKMSAM